METKLRSESWKVIRKFPFYEASNLGRIRRLMPAINTKPGKIVQPIRSKRGYAQVNISMGRFRKTVFVHQLIAGEFLVKPKKYGINHKDGNKLKNSASNLEWASPIENMRHAIKFGLIKPLMKWARKYGCCKLCGTVKREHAANGFCVNCYRRNKRNIL